MRTAAALVIALVIVGLRSAGLAAEFMCGAGDTACLIASIRMANALHEPSTIHLREGVYTLTGVDNQADGPNGLPLRRRARRNSGFGDTRHDPPTGVR